MSVRPFNLQIITNAVMNTTVTSAPLELTRVLNYAIQAVYAGTPTGTLELQGSCDPSGDVASPLNATNVPTNWTVILNSNIAITGPGNYVFNVFHAGYNWVRLVYLDGSGGTSTAVLNARINAKGY